MPSRPFRFSPLVALALLTLACGGTPAPAAPSPASQHPTEPVRPFAAAIFAGQSIAVLPQTMVLAGDTLGRVPPLGDRATALAWADSLVGAELLARGPEVKWVLPAELRRVAHRAPAVAPDPDRMGQSLLRARQLEDVPDPLRGQLRTLMALLGGRFALVPAAIQFLPESTGTMRAEVSMVLADARTGKVVWRTVTWGTGATPAEALTRAMQLVLPAGLDIR
ncbi:MAG: hypothetical protein IPI38_06045 [Gemmatimonadetes bacterium]|nr:hypothetical protein [Gemmatimonadota bacterium]MBK6780253.1 hypothetical protein [Gemmatimonadota bacterium]MBK7714967.1 hypothetical protein [Gemmatimonadota bacterium]MBK7922521.1 hypothetical protein [Gemmatimonadota bacterium]MBK9691572.1 hypothetical protein [Gemmatimonadota bacterium]